jgi:hypothetical protein
MVAAIVPSGSFGRLASAGTLSHGWEPSSEGLSQGRPNSSRGGASVHRRMWRAQAKGGVVLRNIRLQTTHTPILLAPADSPRNRPSRANTLLLRQLGAFMDSSIWGAHPPGLPGRRIGSQPRSVGTPGLAGPATPPAKGAACFQHERLGAYHTDALSRRRERPLSRTAAVVAGCRKSP